METDKKRLGIFGAGQAGVMAARWLPAGYELVCFIDNDIGKQNRYLDGISVVSLEEALLKDLDVIWIAILNREAGTEIQNQIESTGFSGVLRNIQEIRSHIDIRLAALRLLAKEVKERGICGEAAELGVYRGTFAAEINGLFPERKLYLFDTFSGFAEEDLETEYAMGNFKVRKEAFSDTSVELVRSRLPYPEQAIFCKGHFPDSLPDSLPRFALVSLDPDLYEPTYEGLKIFYPQLSSGGMILIHDYNSLQFPGIKRAVRKYCGEHGLYVVPLMDLHGTAILLKK